MSETIETKKFAVILGNNVRRTIIRFVPGSVLLVHCSLGAQVLIINCGLVPIRGIEFTGRFGLHTSRHHARVGSGETGFAR
jgi:hypothetical protein